jgi:1-deoxy-D-xylulose-5-phosphate synthase
LEFRSNKNSVAIFIPSNGIVEDTREGLHDYSAPCYKIEEKGKDVVILGSNDFYYHAKNVYLELKKHNINATLINPLFLDLDKNTLDKFKNEKLFVTIEGGILDGALGQKIASYYGTSKVKVKNYGLRKENIDRFKVDDILKSNHMLVDDIVSDILEELSK